MILPDIGDLNRRVLLLSVNHTPTGEAELTKGHRTIAEVWGKVEINGGSAYWDSVNIDEAVTHRVYVRYVQNLTRPQDLKHLTELEIEGVTYRVRRCTDVNGAHRFTMLECEEVGYVDP